MFATVRSDAECGEQRRKGDSNETGMLIYKSAHITMTKDQRNKNQTNKCWVFR